MPQPPPQHGHQDRLRSACRPRAGTPILRGPALRGTQDTFRFRAGPCCYIRDCFSRPRYAQYADLDKASLAKANTLLGWADSNSPSFTWFEAELLRPPGRPSVATLHLNRNAAGDPKFRTGKVSWNSQDINSSSVNVRTFHQELQSDDVIQLCLGAPRSVKSSESTRVLRDGHHFLARARTGGRVGMRTRVHHAQATFTYGLNSTAHLEQAWSREKCTAPRSISRNTRHASDRSERPAFCSVWSKPRDQWTREYPDSAPSRLHQDAGKDHGRLYSVVHYQTAVSQSSIHDSLPTVERMALHSPRLVES